MSDVRQAVASASGQQHLLQASIQLSAIMMSMPTGEINTKYIDERSMSSMWPHSGTYRSNRTIGSASVGFERADPHQHW